MHVVHAECFRTRDQALPHVISSPEQAQPNAEPAVLIEEHAGFEFLIPANQDRRASPVCQGIGRDKVFGVGGEIVFLAAALTQLANLRQARVEFPVTENQVGCSCAVTNPEPALESFLTVLPSSCRLLSINPLEFTLFIPNITGYRATMLVSWILSQWAGSSLGKEQQLGIQLECAHLILCFFVK